MTREGFSVAISVDGEGTLQPGLHALENPMDRPFRTSQACSRLNVRALLELEVDEAALVRVRSERPFVLRVLQPLPCYTRVCPIKTETSRKTRSGAGRRVRRELLDSGGKSVMDERWLSVEEIAAHLGIKRDTVYKWITRKQLPAHKLGKLWKFNLREVDEWVRSGRISQRERANAGFGHGGAQS